MSGTANILEKEAQSSERARTGSLSDSRTDYEEVSALLQLIAQNPREEFSPASLASGANQSVENMQSLFRRWAGLDAEEFLQAISIEHARNMLAGSADLLEIADAMGVSGPARFHDLLIAHQTMTPAEAKKQQGGFAIRYGFQDCPFGIAVVMITDQGICGMGFCDQPQEQNAMLEDMKRWPDAEYIEDQKTAARAIANVFSDSSADSGSTINIVLIGTEFEIKVWEALLKVPVGRAVTYTDLAEHIGSPGAHRAVGSAVGRNPISFIAPCHRVLRKDAALGGYHWGVVRKQALIGWEAGKLKAEMES